MYKGARRYLGVGRKEMLPGKHNERNVFLQPTPHQVIIQKHAPGLVAIQMKGADNLLCPVWGTPVTGRGMVTYKDVKNLEKRLFEQIRVAGGFQLRYHLKPSLYLGISEDGHPTLSETPVVWQEPADFAAAPSGLHLWSF